jgi:CheY-specific phosphatase CheX
VAYEVRLKERRPAPTAALVHEVAAGAAIVAAVVGFNGSDLRGTALLATTFELAALARPASLRKVPLSASTASDWIIVRNWAGELCNQVIGRIKNKLNRNGIALDVSPPAAFSGSALTFALPKSPAAYHFVFGTDHHTVWFCFDAQLDAGRPVAAGAVDKGAGEGKVIVFD